MSQSSKIHDSIKRFYDFDGITYLERRWLATPTAQFDFASTKNALSAALQNSRFDNMLEVGPGPGTWTRFLLDHSHHITLVEISETMLGKARERITGPNVDFIHGDFVNIHFSTRFQMIAAIRCFEYFSNKLEFLSKCHAALIQGGKLLIITKTKGSYWYGKSRIRSMLRHMAPGLFKYDDYHVTGCRGGLWQERLFVRDSVKLLQQCGFEVLFIRPVILRPPIFMRGKYEIPLVPPQAEATLLNLFRAFDRTFSRYHQFTVFAESYLIMATAK